MRVRTLVQCRTFPHIALRQAFQAAEGELWFDSGSNLISFRSMVRSHRVLNFELSSFHGAPFHTFAWDDRTKQTRLRRDSATKGLPRKLLRREQFEDVAIRIAKVDTTPATSMIDVHIRYGIRLTSIGYALGF
jgi:hypothetical protein